MFWIYSLLIVVALVSAVWISRQRASLAYLAQGSSAFGQQSSGAAGGGGGWGQTELRVMSQNLWLHYLVPAPERTQRVQLFIEKVREQVEQFDVVVIEEAFLLKLGPLVWSSHVEQLTRGLHSLGFCYWTNPADSLPPFFGQNSGLIIFSKLPFSAPPHSHTFQRHEFLNQKGFVDIEVYFPFASVPSSEEKGMVAVQILGTHLDAHGEETKQSQLLEIQRRVEELMTQDADKVIIMAGDWNICPRTQYLQPGSSIDVPTTLSYNLLRQTFPLFVNAFEEGPVSVRQARFRSFRSKPPTVSLIAAQLLSPWYRLEWPRALTSESLDHVFFGSRRTAISAASARMLDWVTLDDRGLYLFPVSDHLGVAVHFSFRPVSS